MPNRFFIFAYLLIFLVAGCSSTAQPAVTGSDLGQNAAKSAADGYNRDLLKTYASTFLIQFDGATKWKYQLQTKKSPTWRESKLHIEGITGANNPGDVRLVTDGTSSWMIGPGTDEECVRFPNNQGMDPALIYPESLLPWNELSGFLTLAGEETVSGKTSLHYTASAPSAGGWKDVRVDVYQEKSSGALLQFAMLAAGNDTIFGTGAGSLMAQYTVDELAAPVIETVKGCEISVPLPDSAAKFVRLPGMASFESQAGIDQISQFYKDQLPQSNWLENEPPMQSEGSVVLSYRRDAEEVEIHIEAAPSGSKVKLLFVQVQ